MTVLVSILFSSKIVVARVNNMWADDWQQRQRLDGSHVARLSQTVGGFQEWGCMLCTGKQIGNQDVLVTLIILAYCVVILQRHESVFVLLLNHCSSVRPGEVR